MASFWLAGISDWRKGFEIEEKDLRATTTRRGTEIERERGESEANEREKINKIIINGLL